MPGDVANTGSGPSVASLDQPALTNVGMRHWNLATAIGVETQIAQEFKNRRPVKHPTSITRIYEAINYLIDITI
eukprot:COSAG02_NODE_674_length_18616_cov_5.948750_5_plen_74_part_00